MIVRAKTYKDCNELPMANFIRCAIDNDLTALYKHEIKFWHRKTDLDVIWDKIHDEYKSLTGQNGPTELFSFMKEREYLINKLRIIDICAKALMIKYSKGWCVTLKRNGFSYPFTEKTYLKDLDMVLSKVKTIGLKLGSLTKKINDLQQTETKDTSADDFNKVTVELERNMGVNIDLETCSVSKFIAYINNIKENGKRAKN